MKRITMILSLILCIKLAYAQNININDSLAKWRGAIKQNPKCAECYSNLGNALHYVKSDSATWAYQQAVNLDPKDTAYYFQLANTYEDYGKLDMELQAYLLLLKNLPSADALGDVGAAYADNKDWPNAIKYYQKAYGAKKSVYQYPLNIAVAFSNMGKHDSAITYFKKSLALNPEDVEEYNEIAIEYDAIGDVKNYIKYEDEYRKRNPDYVQKVANSSYLSNQYEAKKQLAQNPTSDNYFKLAEIYYGYGESSDHDYKLAVVYYNKAISINPSNGKALYRLGTIYGNGMLGTDKLDYKRAIEYYSKAAPSLPAIDMNPINPMSAQMAYAYTGGAYEQLKDYNNAIIYFKKAVAANPQTGKSFYGKISECYTALGDSKEADYYAKLQYQ